MISPGTTCVIIGTWSGYTPICPSLAGNVTISTSTANAIPCGVTISSFIVSLIPAPLQPRPPRTPHQRSASLNLLDPALHVEVPFRHAVVRAVEDLLEAADGVGDGDLTSFAPGEHLRGAERLTQKPLDLAGAEHRHLVLRRQLVHPENGDDVLQVLEPLQHLLNAARHVVVLLADDVG